MVSKGYSIKKEARMKKTIIILLALFLALPAISFAGSVTSRWDMTIGGYVKADMGWADTGFGLDSNNATRKGLPGVRENRASEYGVLGMAAGETRLNFLVKGPDAWGAKTSAFFSGDFISFFGGEAAPPGTGGFGLMLAQMTFDWPNTSLLIG